MLHAHIHSFAHYAETPTPDGLCQTLHAQQQQKTISKGDVSVENGSNFITRNSNYADSQHTI